ncbi:type I-E CRISPR-associated endoribonuclease Cas2e [Glycomyces sp. L485]|uniref:type I-E CRISPR-associated endoribonuclease Cas2e n=1 Tax=Glycomyces sp. L485 TaxID=2909235 RepID=UPI001F4B714E|nr:type I-E CRISPR-associated endoribonuclease Cas2e [Glycomyces sp. L485]MCH7230513.1 type I-E CRISPR-associated endoribonuclease Cas2e [Glycomyces sp. L485]
MTVIVLTACPAGLRGHLTQWMLEISAGVFVGKLSRRVRERLWARVQELAGSGRALLVYQTNNEQGYTFEAHDHQWEPVDFDGVTLMKRPASASRTGGKLKPGWSKASKRRRFGS